jgi:hypothetical protein
MVVCRDRNRSLQSNIDWMAGELSLNEQLCGTNELCGGKYQQYEPACHLTYTGNKCRRLCPRTEKQAIKLVIGATSSIVATFCFRCSTEAPQCTILCIDVGRLDILRVYRTLTFVYNEDGYTKLASLFDITEAVRNFFGHAVDEAEG